jgi:DNA modification methylase
MDSEPGRPASVDAPTYERIPLGWVKLPERNARKHPERQVDEIVASMRASGVINPLIVDGDYRLIAGEGRYRALKKMREMTAAVLVVTHLTTDQARAFAIADNRIPENSSWDIPALALELRDLQLSSPQLDLTVTGFGHAHIEQLVTNLDQTSWSDLDKPAEPRPEEHSVTREGDVWEFEGGHKLGCFDSTDRLKVWELMGDDQASQVVTDSPFNRDDKTYSRQGHGNFAMGYGELSRSAFVTFLARSIAAIQSHLVDGALAYMFMDWQHIHELLDAGREQDLALKNLLVWDKGKGGMGSLYRSGHELICLFKHGDGPHINNIMLGKNGRDRSNVLRYAGMNRFGGGREKALSMHPTVKPVQLICDLILDASHPGDIIFDGFGGSGTTLIAAHKMERRARIIELSPRYCDTIIERFKQAFGAEPTLLGTPHRFSDVARSRLAEEDRHGQ